MPQARRDYSCLDFINIDEMLTEEEILTRNTTRQFIADRVSKHIESYFSKGQFPFHLVPEMAELGFFGASLEGYGCAGVSNVANGLIMQELEACDSGLRSFVSVQSALVMWPIFHFGSEEQKSKWLPLMAKGQAIGCFGLTEPGFGSNPGGMKSYAINDGDSWILNGEKTWITNGNIADVAIVWARDLRDKEIKGFLVEEGTPGFTTDDIHNKWSLRASITSSLTLHDCRIPHENILPGALKLSSALQCLTQARYGIGWGCIGAAANCFDTALKYCCERKQFNNKPIASHQLVQAELADMQYEISKAQTLALHIGRLKDKGKSDFAQISMLKDNNARMARNIASRSRELMGANGITDDYPFGRHIANLETVVTYEGTHNMHSLIVGEKLTGIPAF